MSNGGNLPTAGNGTTTADESWGYNQLAAINEAIASGASTVSYNGKSVTYRSLDDLLRLRQIVMAALGLVPTISGTILAAHNRGYPGPWYDQTQVGW